MSELLKESKSVTPSNSKSEESTHRPWERIGIWRTCVALLIAALADTIGIIPGEMLPVVFDLAVAALLCVAVGFRVELLVALLAEAIPGVGLFPSWIVAVISIVIRSRADTGHNP